MHSCFENVYSESNTSQVLLKIFLILFLRVGTWPLDKFTCFVLYVWRVIVDKEVSQWPSERHKFRFPVLSVLLAAGGGDGSVIIMFTLQDINAWLFSKNYF